jgi:hypothetical protein
MSESNAPDELFQLKVTGSDGEQVAIYFESEQEVIDYYKSKPLAEDVNTIWHLGPNPEGVLVWVECAIVETDPQIYRKTHDGEG